MYCHDVMQLLVYNDCVDVVTRVNRLLAAGVRYHARWRHCDQAEEHRLQLPPRAN
jgi:hypothetical protein